MLKSLAYVLHAADGAVAVCHLKLCTKQLDESCDSSAVKKLVLEKFAALAAQVCRQKDQLLCLSAHEYLLVMVDMVDENHVHLAELKLTRLIGDIGEHHDCPIHAGLVYVAKPHDWTEDTESLIERVRHATQQAQAAALLVKVVDAADPLMYASQTLINQQVEQALDRHELVLVYQPKVDLLNAQIYGAEALVRWQRDGQLVSPGQFLPHLSEAMMWSLTQYCYRLLLREMVNHEVQLPIALNLDPTVFKQPDLVAFFAREAALWGMAPELITFEIVESAEIADCEATAQALYEMVEHGFRIAIDDFGVGYSNLQRLKDFPIHELKLDASLIRDVLHNELSAQMVKGVVAMGSAMHITVVAEGVEDGATLAQLRAWQCPVVQGYYTGYPMPLELLSEGLVPAKHRALAGLDKTAGRGE